MKKIFGHTDGLKQDQIRRIENLYRRRIPPYFLITPELAKDIGRISSEIRRQIGVLINRQGKIFSVIVGDQHKIIIPDTPEYRTIPGRLKGLRCIHTHIGDEPLTPDDLTDLSLLRLDLMAVICLRPEGNISRVHFAHVLPKPVQGKYFQVMDPLDTGRLDIGCLELIQALEDEMSQMRALYDADTGKERAFLVSVTTDQRRMAAKSMSELKELARSSDIEIVDTIIQRRAKIDHRFLMGIGKIREMAVQAMEKGVSIVIFDQELNPSQIRSITDSIELKVIDRTQLILDIFARRAQTREGKLQVELAQLKYMLPRLVGKNTALSRLEGGIGGRGPGETKLEVDRRRARDRIARLTKDLKKVRKQRKLQKAKRNKQGLPVISIIGYTNAGKSTLLNTLTQSKVVTEDRMFATLDPSSRRLRFPRDTQVIITDTVGFIRDLPKDLMVAFRATLEELESADLLIHVIDISNPEFSDQIESVEKILDDLNVNNIPTIRVFNKRDLIDDEQVEILCLRYEGFAISSTKKTGLAALVETMERRIGPSEEDVI